MMVNNQFKEKLKTFCLQFIENRVETIQNSISEIQESLTSETKSTAGDKHETGRAMLQLEREKTGNQLAEIQKIKLAFSKIDFSKASKTIGLGSIVLTSNSNYFIAISAGEIEIDSISFYAISPNTPIGQLIIGKIVGDVINFRNQSFTIKSVF